jgi:hypothetical protein
MYNGHCTFTDEAKLQARGISNQVTNCSQMLSKLSQADSEVEKKLPRITFSFCTKQIRLPILKPKEKTTVSVVNHKICLQKSYLARSI